MSDLRVGLIDANQAVRSGRALVINSQPDMRIVFEESDLDSAIQNVPDYLVDAIVVGPSNHQARGGQFVKTLAEAMRAENNSGVIIAYGPFATDDLRFSAICAGAQDYVGLDEPGSKLLQLIRLVVKQDFLVSPIDLKNLAGKFENFTSNLSLEEQLRELTDVQTRIIELFLLGNPDAAISKQLDLARTRVTKLIEELMRGAGFVTRNQLVLGLMGRAK